MNRSPINLFLSVFQLPINGGLAALAVMHHSAGWLVWSFVWSLWSAYQITREVYL